jgi:GT2 family glycosyltransferase
LEGTRYPAFNILIVDNGSTDRATFDFFAQLSGDSRIEVLKFPGEFNYSAINNFGARHAAGEFLCLMKNDVEVLTPDWLGEMMRQAVRPDTGAVGAKLLYSDGTIQHAGIVLGMGAAAGHAHRYLPNEDIGYFAQAHLSRGVSAVTAACLVVEKFKFFEVSGLDEVVFRVAYNDVDFCLKLSGHGWINRYVPTATLLHHESKSRRNDLSPDQMDRYQAELHALQRRWSTETLVDPLHHPCLDRSSETYLLGF